MKFKLLVVLLIFNFTGRVYAQLPAYPVEEFSADTAFQVHRVVDGDTVVIDHNGWSYPVLVDRFGLEISGRWYHLLS